MASPRLAVLELAAGGRQVLEGWARRRKAARALALRWRVVLACAGGMASSEVAAGLRVSRAMVARWRSRFAMARLEGLSGGRRPGASGKVTGEHAGLVLAGMLEARGPGGDTHWSTRSVAAAAGLSRAAVWRIWRAFGLRPYLVWTWMLCTDAVHREGARCRGLVPGPAGRGAGAVRR